MADKKVTIKVGTDVDLSDVDSLETKLKELQQLQIKKKLEVDTANLDEVNSKIQSLKTNIANMEAGEIEFDDDQLTHARDELEALEQEKIDLEIAVAKDQLDLAEDEVDELDGKEVNLQLATQNFMMGLQTLKQGVSELATNVGEVLGSAGRLEQTEAFLSMNIGAEQAKKKLEEIRSVTDQLPGDDVTLQNLLSQAALKDAGMGVDAFKQMGSAAADYMAAMQNFGKTSTETQQDLMNYILAGNTAEIERSPILQAHIDKLKTGATIQERSKLLQEALTAEGWKGVASLDIYNNKQQQFNDMLERGKIALGDQFLKGTEGAMEYALQLDNATDGLVGMGVAAAQMAGGPAVDFVSGLGQMAMGLKALKDLELTSTLRTWAGSFLNLGKAALTAGYNALTSAGMWLVEKAQLVASTMVKGAATVASWALAAAEWAAASPLLLLAVLIGAVVLALVALYMNSEQVRVTIDNMAQSFWNAMTSMGTAISDTFTAIDQWLTESINSFNNWGNNLVNTIVNAASSAVNGFVSRIGGMYNALVNELNQMLSAVGNWASQLWNRFKDAASNAVQAFLAGLGINSPGIMQRTLIWEISEMGNRVPDESQNLLRNVSTLGSDVVDSFGDPSLNLDYNLNSQLSNNAKGNVNADDLRPVNLTLNVGTVDSEERLQELYEGVIRLLRFENSTAGRSV